MALAPILGGLASAGATFGLSKLFGSGQQAPMQVAQQFSPTGINAGGLTSSFSGGNLTMAPTAERLALVDSLSGTFGNQAGELAGLRSQVAPGMSALRASRMAEIEDARNRSIGNLRDNLARRRVLGSSFGQDAISRGEAEFAGLRDRTAAETFMQELQLTNELMNQEFMARRGQFQTGLNDLNLQADLAAQITAKTTETMQKQSALMTELAFKERQGQGSFFGALAQPIAAGIGQSISGYKPIGSFGPSSGFPAYQ